MGQKDGYENKNIRYNSNIVSDNFIVKPATIKTVKIPQTAIIKIKTLNCIRNLHLVM